MEELLENVADRMAMLVQKPSTRVQACQLLAKTKVKVTTKELDKTCCRRISKGKSTVLSCLTWRPSTLRRKETGWTTPWTSTTRSGRALLKLRFEIVVLFPKHLKIKTPQAKAETLCVCWNKLDQDVSELTKAITSGGGSKVGLENKRKS